MAQLAGVDPRTIGWLAVVFVILSFFGIGIKALLWSLALALLGLPVYRHVQNQANKSLRPESSI